MRTAPITDTRGEEFGEPRLVELVRAHRGLGAHALKDRLLETVRAFGTFVDDTTLLVLAVD